MAGKYGQFEAYEPAPDVGEDAFRFKLANGDTKLFSGPNALDLASRIDAYDQAQPKLAKAPTAAPTSRTDAGGGPRVEFDAVAGKPVRVGTTTVEEPQAQPTGPVPDADGNVPIAPGYYRDAAGQIHETKVVAGSPGVTREQLLKRDEGAVAQRKGETTQVQAGTPESQEYLDTRSALRDAEYDALVKQRQDEQAAVDEQSRIAAEQERAQLRLMSEAEARKAELDTKFKREEALRNKAVEEYSSSTVEPNRIIANPISGLLSGLANGIGAYAAVIGKTPNYAQQTIEAAIARDIRAQEAQIAVKGETKDTLIGQLRETGMSREQARAAAEQIQIRYHQAQNETARLKHAGTALENKFNNIGIGLQQAWNEADERGRVASQDKVVKTTQSGFEHEKAATRGGVVDRVLGGKEALGVLGTLQDLEKGDIANQKGRLELQAGPKGAPASPEKRDAAGALAEAAVLKDIAAQHGGKEGSPAYEAQGLGGRAWETGVNFIFGEGAGVDDKTALSRQDWERVKAGLGEANSKLGGQGSMIGDERAVFAKAMSPGATWGDAKRAIVMMEKRAQARGRAAEQVGEAGGTVVTK